MVAVWQDAVVDDDARREQLYDGAIHLTAPTTATCEFADFARNMVSDAFDGVDPERAQFMFELDRYVAVLAALKPSFIHHGRSKELVSAVLAERGCDLDRTYFDVPRLRSSTSDGYLTTGIAYAWHPHRDTWYSAPMAQLNYWMPIYAICPQNAMAFHFEHFASPIANNSEIYNYYEWNRKYRASAAANVHADERPLPRPTDVVDLEQSVVFLPAVGGMIQFSGAQLHSSVPNTSGVTRFSIDFRTVDIDDIRSGRGAANVDSNCTGSSIRDFIRASDFSPVPDDVVEMFHDGTEARGDLLFGRA